MSHDVILSLLAVRSVIQPSASQCVCMSVLPSVSFFPRIQFVSGELRRFQVIGSDLCVATVTRIVVTVQTGCTKS